MTGRTIDAHGIAWSVRELDSSHTPGAPTSVSLICESPALVRRVWRFPGEWQRLSDAEVLALFGIG